MIIFLAKVSFWIKLLNQLLFDSSILFFPDTSEWQYKEGLTELKK